MTLKVCNEHAVYVIGCCKSGTLANISKAGSSMHTEHMRRPKLHAAWCVLAGPRLRTGSS